jgi:murein DD-endopeptidase MepM/ murein hydrolase activator NlpD
MKQKIKIALLLIGFLFGLVSCWNSEKPKSKNEPIIHKFGFTFNNYNVENDTVEHGDSFGSIISKQNLGKLDVYDIVEKVKDSFDVKIIRVGKPYTFLRSKDRFKKLQAFIYEPDKGSYYVIHLNDTSVSISKKIKSVTIKPRLIVGKLNGSLSETLNKQGVDAALASQLAKVYAWSIDFFKLQKGSEFGIKFSERYIEDSIYDGVDSLSAAFFQYKGKRIYAFPFIQNKTVGKVDYYDENGLALKNFFLKAPLKFANITSRFAKNRFHPVQHIWKAHKGTDYAALTGTPVMTTASGVVEATGYTTGNGNFVKIKHNKTYATQYLHLSKILVRRGQTVTQGKIIGRVGSTGLATGPHVCYRFWKNGKQVDALRLKLPNAEPMNKANLPRYLAQINPLKKELDSLASLKFKK